jgi:predicted nucleic acid-binding protein
VNALPLFDTNALIPLFNQQHPRHADARKRFETTDQVVLHPTVIYEITMIIRRMANKAGLDGNERARIALLTLLKEPKVTVQADMDYQRVVDMYVAHPGLSFTDAVIARSSEHFDKKEPVTYDKKIHRARTTNRKDIMKRRKDMDLRIPKT